MFAGGRTCSRPDSALAPDGSDRTADDPQNAPTAISEFSLPTTAGRICLGRRKRQVCGMANRVEECLRKAEQCEQAGSFAVTLEARLMFYGLAQQRRDVADCFEEIEQQLAAKREPADVAV